MKECDCNSKCKPCICNESPSSPKKVNIGGIEFGNIDFMFGKKVMIPYSKLPFFVKQQLRFLEYVENGSPQA